MRGRGGQIIGDSHRDDLFARHADQFLRRLVRDQLPVVDDGDAVAQFLGLFEVVRGQHHGHPFAVQLADQLPQLAAQFDIDSGGGFIQHQNWRRMYHRLGHQ